MPDPPIRHVTQVDSTNRLALSAKDDGAVFWADSQTAGRGQHGRRWESAALKGLWFSMCVAGPPTGLQFTAALAVRDTLAKYAPVSLKWPNDLLLNGKKVCGILVEHAENWNAVGIGVNISHELEDFPPELQHIATSLGLVCGGEWERESLLGEMLQSLDRRIAQLRSGQHAEIFEEWAEACNIVGRVIERDTVRGRVIALEENGALRVETPVGVQRVDSGCVAILEES